MFFRKQKPAGNDNREVPAKAAPATSTAAATAADVAPRAAAPVDANTSAVLAGTSVMGNIDCEGDLVIDGTVRGSVRAQRLTIGHEGLIEGDVSADNLRIGGRIKGPIHTRHVHLEQKSEVEGDITTETIAIDTGARLTGAVWQGQQQQQQQQPERYTPITTSSWENTLGDNSRLTAIRPRLTDTGR